jgi:hypothetical protein
VGFINVPVRRFVVDPAGIAAGGDGSCIRRGGDGGSNNYSRPTIVED